MSATTTIDQQPDGVVAFCDQSLGAYWKPGRWKRDKLRGAALTDDELRDQDVMPADIFRAPFHVGWMIETVAHDGEWCDPVWPVYRLETAEPKPGVTSMEVSWLDFA
jgi:hypothetical protein